MEEKRRYNNRAKSEKQTHFGKQTGLGESVALLEKRKREQADFEIKMRNYIETLINEAEMANSKFNCFLNKIF